MTLHGAFVEVYRSELERDDSDSSGILKKRGCSISKLFRQMIYSYEECQP